MRLQNLCTIEDDTLSGPMSPILLMQEATRQMDDKYRGICRVHWDDDRYMQLVDEDSGLDTVIYLSGSDENIRLSMFVDTGIGAVPVAIHFIGDETIFTPVYTDDTTLIHPPEQDILNVFKSVSDDMSVIIPIQQDHTLSEKKHKNDFRWYPFGKH